MNSFSFYNNYYVIIKHLSDKDRLKLLDAILKYMFDNEEPQLDGLLLGIWTNIKMPLDTSKKNAGRGGAPKGNQNAKKNNPKTTDNQPKNNPKDFQKQTNNISYFLFLISNNNYKYIYNNSSIYKKIIEWLEYKEERKEKYKETGLKSLLSQIENQIDLYGEKEVVKLIGECMASNYKGIIFDKLKNIKQKNQESIPSWFDKDIKEQQMTKEEQQEMEDLLSEFN